MGKKSRAELIAELKSAGTRGSLSKMNLICLTAMDDAVPGMRVRIQDTESMVTLR